MQDSLEMQKALWARLTSGKTKTGSVPERVLFAAFADELEKLAYLSRGENVARGRGPRTGGFNATRADFSQTGRSLGVNKIDPDLIRSNLKAHAKRGVPKKSALGGLRRAARTGLRAAL